MAERSETALSDWLTCKVCKRRLNSSNGLHAHVRQKHKMSAMDYYTLYLDALVARIVAHTEEVQVVDGMTPCWEWTGLQSERGYGRMRVAGGPTTAAHRYALLTRIHSLDDVETVRHRCDHPPCCNPEHLEPGTQLENVADREERGRTAVGNTASGKLTDHEVVSIRLRSDLGEKCRMIAQDFPVAEETIRRVSSGTSYAHVANDFIPF